MHKLENLSQDITIWGELNRTLKERISPDAQIGHSYFFQAVEAGREDRIWEELLLPQLAEILVSFGVMTDKKLMGELHRELETGEYCIEVTGEGSDAYPIVTKREATKTSPLTIGGDPEEVPNKATMDPSLGGLPQAVPEDPRYPRLRTEDQVTAGATAVRRGFRASPNGNGVGVAVVFVPSDWGPPASGSDVLPKFWPGPKGPQWTDLDAEPATLRPSLAGLTKVVIQEGQALVLESRHQGRLDLCTQALIGLTFLTNEDEEPEPTDAENDPDQVTAPNTASATVGNATTATESTPVLVRLFRELTASQIPASRPTNAPMLPTHSSRDLWQLCAEANCLDLLKVPSYASEKNLTTYVAGTILAHVTELRALTMRQFLVETKAIVARRKSQFRSTSDELTTVRGQINFRSLPRSTARGKLAIECTFDELDDDTPWQRLLLAAVTECRHELSGESWRTWHDEAVRLEHRLNDVSKVHPREALRETRHLRFHRSTRPMRTACILGEGILRSLYPFGTEDDPVLTHPGVAAAVRVSTAELFERLLATLDGLSDNSDAVKIRVNAPKSKRPDLAIRGETDPIGYLDAKYKPVTSHQLKASKTLISGMSMSDQYQQYAYTAATGLPTGFVYVRRGATSLANDIDTVMVKGAANPQRIGCTAVNFPEPGELANWRDSTTAERPVSSNS